MKVIAPGVQTTVQDLPGRTGHWGVGVPPSGAWDDRSFALANIAVGNDPGAAGLEAVLNGPVLRFTGRALVCLTGAVGRAVLDGRRVRPGVPVAVSPGMVLDLGLADGGLRQYLAVRGGLDVPHVLGSRATFLLGGFGGHEGRALREGDELAVRAVQNPVEPAEVTPLLRPPTGTWDLRVVPGPHGAPDYLTEDGLATFFGAEWRVDHRSDRTGVRLAGPVPAFARTDGGEAGLHPSNIHDSAYPVGGIMLSGGTPVIVGPDGPSLGGFVVPAAVVRADRWKLAQARPGDTVRLRPVTPEEAAGLNAARAAELADVRSALATFHLPEPRDARPAPEPGTPARGTAARGPVVRRPAPLLDLPATGGRPALTARRSGDHHLLIECGPPVLDLVVRMRMHLLARAIAGLALAGLKETVEGVRSLLLAVDERRLPLDRLAEAAGEAWLTLADPATVELPVREVTLPIALDDPSVHEAMRRYQTSVRPDAPWCPDNVEFIRRINGLASREEVFGVVAAAEYLVVGLGDVYLGAPVAVPLDPAHRLVTTKYDPARTWTPANAVGIGGTYLCVYGMEGPGGYQMFGRTVPVWRLPNRGDPPWLLRHFDRLRFEPVSAAELARARADIAAGHRDLETKPATLTLADLTPAETPEAAAFTARRRAAFAAERARWAEQPGGGAAAGGVGGRPPSKRKATS
ncbi:5-oxoprolinase/urea amidolyase family protein [Spirillospora sp. NPDC047279]|uniref:5-oxoprolinase/urea amidolyase family protein n=1 Tax=Spirillospora sp. NPDC047279 TaxID=3155478 RepID=UPI0033E2BEBF